MINGRLWSVEYLDAEDGYAIMKLGVVMLLIAVVSQSLLPAIESAMSTAVAATHNVDISQATKIFKSLRLLSWAVSWLLLFATVALLIAAMASRRY